MTLRYQGAATNNADWLLQFELRDGDTDDLLDLSAATIEIDVRDNGGCEILTATTSNGRVEQVSTGIIEMTIPASAMSDVCVGTYKFGGRYTLNDETISIFTGTVQIIDGVAR